MHGAQFVLPEAEVRRLLAVGLIAGDLSAHVISRYGSVELRVGQAAIDLGQRSGLIVDGVVGEAHAIELIGEMSAADVAEIHAAIARHLMAQGPSRLLDAVDHVRAAGSLVEFDELASLAEHAARTSLSIGDYESARQLLALADSVVYADSPQQRCRRLIDLAVALDGLGRVPEARDSLAQAFGIAELAGETALAVDAAVAYSMPADWYAGDLRASALLQRAEAMPLSVEQRLSVDAARAVVEMRIPIAPDKEQQVAWVTRASIAQRLSEGALADAIDVADEVRLLALVAWRSTHRTPTLLDRRREVSNEALDLAQRLRRPGRQMDAAVMVAVDALESADRPLFDQASSVLRWVAERDGNPRFGWHAHTIAAGAANMEGDLDASAHHRRIARELGQSVAFPGWLGADLILQAQEIFARGDLDEIARHIPDEGSTEMLNSLAKFTIAHARALLGDHEDAARLLRKGLLQLDEESSYLLNLSCASSAAALIDVPDVVEELFHRLQPFANHVAVDSNAWWCNGPIAYSLALLAHLRGDSSEAWRHIHDAEMTARRMGDVRSLERISRLRDTMAPPPELDTETFTEREREVLRLLASGRTNPEIALELRYSPSTIRNDVSSIYRKLGVSSRPEAAAVASSLELI